MAIEFDGATQYTDVNTGVAVGFPLTFSCWFYPHSAASVSLLFGMFNNAGDDAFRLFANAGVVSMQTYNDPASGLASSSTSYTANTWNHACGTITSGASRAAFLNGGGKGTNTTSITSPVSAQYMHVGKARAGTAYYMDGFVAEVALYDAVLSDAEVALLANGFSPRLVRRQNLYWYVPFVTASGIELRRGATHTLYNTPVSAPHPRMYYPAGSDVIEYSSGTTPPTRQPRSGVTMLTSPIGVV